MYINFQTKMLSGPGVIEKSVLNWVVPSTFYYFASAYSFEIIRSSLSFPAATQLKTSLFLFGKV